MKVIKEELRKISYQDIKNLKNAENKRYDPEQLLKYNDGRNNDKFLVGYFQDNDLLAVAVLHENRFDIGETFIDEIQSIKKGYGSYLLKELIRKYKNIVLLCDPSAEGTLRQYYINQGLKEVRLEDSIWGVPISIFYYGNLKSDDIVDKYGKYYQDEE